MTGEPRRGPYAVNRAGPAGRSQGQIMRGVYLQAIRVLGLLLFFLAGQAHAAEQAALKTGVQTLPGALPKIGEKDSPLEWNFDLSQEQFYISVPRNYLGNQP